MVPWGWTPLQCKTTGNQKSPAFHLRLGLIFGFLESCFCISSVAGLIEENPSMKSKHDTSILVYTRLTVVSCWGEQGGIVL